MPSPLSKFYGGWEQHNRLLEGVVAGLDERHLSMRAAPDLWTVRTLLNHVVAVRAWWFNAWMGEGGEQLARVLDFDEGEDAERRDAGEILKGLRSSWSSVAASLASWTEDDLGAEFQRPAANAERGRPWRTRGWIVWHVAEHDMHHGGELSITLGMHGHPGLGL
jgi:uncharacterized damage-inducible protein DinB